VAGRPPTRIVRLVVHGGQRTSEHQRTRTGDRESCPAGRGPWVPRFAASGLAGTSSGDRSARDLAPVATFHRQKSNHPTFRPTRRNNLNRPTARSACDMPLAAIITSMAVEMCEFVETIKHCRLGGFADCEQTPVYSGVSKLVDELAPVWDTEQGNGGFGLSKVCCPVA